MSNDGVCASEGDSTSNHSTPTTPLSQMPPLRLLVPAAPPSSPWTPNARLVGNAGSAVIWNGVETQTLEVAENTIATSTPYVLGSDDRGRIYFVDIRQLLMDHLKMLSSEKDGHQPEETAKRRRSTRRATRAPENAATQ